MRGGLVADDTWGGTWKDYDANGFPDLLVGRHEGRPDLLVNRGGRSPPPA
jgi:hypothetical protein